MRYQDQLIRDTRNATDALFRAARGMSEDKLTWKVTETTRTALDMCAECAQMVPLTVQMLREKRMPPAQDDRWEKMLAARASWTLDDCERICREESETLYAVVKDYPDEDLLLPIDLPFGDREWTMADVASYLLWNLTYHLGQIAFIQTAYGDFNAYV